MLLPALLSACDADKPAPVVPGDDTPADTAAPAGPDPWVPPEPVCTLSRPLAIDAVPELAELAGPDFLAFHALSTYFTSYEREWGCPLGAGDPSGSYSWEGSCAFERFGWDGRWTSVQQANPEGGGESSASVDGVHFYDLDGIGTDAIIDGDARYEELPTGAYTSEVDCTWSVQGYAGAAQNEGDWTVRGFERYVPGTVHTIERYADASPVRGIDGQYCLLQELSPWPDCALEPWGGWVLQGDARLVVTFDPHVTCDGCGTATLDGVSIGEVCGEEYGAVVP